MKSVFYGKKRVGYVYTLSNPSNGIVFYIGSTLCLGNRLQSHISMSSGGGCKKLYDYINKMSEWPIIEEVENVEVISRSELNSVEKYWIEQFRQWGFPIQNTVNNLNHRQPKNKPKESGFMAYKKIDLLGVMGVGEKDLNMLLKSGVVKKHKITRSTIRYIISKH